MYLSPNFSSFATQYSQTKLLPNRSLTLSHVIKAITDRFNHGNYTYSAQGIKMIERMITPNKEGENEEMTRPERVEMNLKEPPKDSESEDSLVMQLCKVDLESSPTS